MARYLAIAKSVQSSAAHISPRAAAILQYWFGDADGWGLPGSLSSEQAAKTAYFSKCPDKAPIWFSGTPAVDDDIRKNFEDDLKSVAAAPEQYDSWTSVESHPRTGLALVLLLDQMTRNVYRGQGQAFALDSIAREATAKVFAHPLYDELRPLEKLFLLLPLEHHEDLQSHVLFKERIAPIMAECSEGGEDAVAISKFVNDFLDFQKEHEVVLQRFGRYPHRNALLGRASTAEEDEFLSKATAGWMGKK